MSGEGRNGPPEETPEVDPSLSAAYLPYDDERLWLQMPDATTGRQSKRSQRERRRRRTRAREAGAGRPARNARLAALAAALVLPVAAFAIFRLTSGSTEPPVVTPSIVVSASASPVVLDITGLRATKITKKSIALSWAAPAAGAITYVVFRDGNPIGDTTETTFVDEQVAAGEYHYYEVRGEGDGASYVTPEQLLVATLTEAGNEPTTSPPAPPPTYAPPPAPSPTRTPSPTKTTSPSPTKTTSPSSTKTPSPSDFEYDYCKQNPTAPICQPPPT